MQATCLKAHVEQMFDGLDNANDADDVSFDEFVGMQGPVSHLVENTIPVLASNAIFLSVVILLPFSLGRVVLYYLSWVPSASSLVLSTVLPLTESVLSVADATTKGAITTAANLSSGDYGESFVGQAIEELVLGLFLRFLSKNTTKPAFAVFLSIVSFQP